MKAPLVLLTLACLTSPAVFAGQCRMVGNTIECPSEAPRTPPATLPPMPGAIPPVPPRPMPGQRPPSYFVNMCRTPSGYCQFSSPQFRAFNSPCWCDYDDSNSASGTTTEGGGITNSNPVW